MVAEMNRDPGPVAGSASAAPRLKLGIPGLIEADIPVPGFIGWMRRTILPKLWEQKVCPVAARVLITVSEDDDGSVDVYLLLVNFTRRDILVDAVTVNWVAISNGGLSDVAANLHGRGPIPRRGIGEIMFRIPLRSAGIRQIQRAVGKHRSLYNSPSAHTAIRGRLSLSRGNSRRVLEFSVQNINPLINLFNPSSKDENT